MPAQYQHKLLPFIFSLMFCFSTPSNAALLMHLPLDGNLSDISGNGNDGVFQGGITNPGFSAAVYNQGLNFDGNNDYITVPSFNPGSTFSASLWVNHDNIGALNTFIEHANNVNNRNDFYIGYDNSNNQLTVELEDNNNFEGGACGDPKFCTGIVLSSNRWYHVVVTVTPTTLNVYIDTALAYTAAHSTTVNFGNGSWLLGGDTDSNPVTTANNDYLDGRIDDARIYNHELNQSEISALYGLTGFWNFDDCSIANSATITDSSGNNIDATALGGVSSTTGKICTAGLFDGTSGYVQIPHNALLNGSTALTYSAWINPTSWGGGIRQIMAKSVHGGGSGRAQMGIFSEGGVLKGRAETAGGRRDVSIALPSTGNWHHVALIFSGNALTLYVDGSSSSTTFTSTTLNSTTDELDISKRVGTSQYFFDGAIDEVRVFNRTMQAEEITSYNANPDPLSRTCPSCSGGSSCFADNYGIYAGDQLIVENNITFTSTSGTSTINNGTTNQSGISLDGTVSTQTLTLTALPAITWVTSPDPDLNDGETLSPGNYDRVRAQNNATITLTPGTYNIDEFNLRNNVTVVISPAGQVIINTNEFTAGIAAIINLGGDPANLIVNIYDQHNAEFDLGDDSNFTGIVYSSFASTLIEIDDDNTFTGAIITAGEVELKDNSTINYTAAAQTAAAVKIGCRIAPTVDILSTPDTTPSITGTYDSANASSGFTVTVDGTTYTLGTSSELTTTGDSWTLAITSPLANGTYDVVATSTNGSGSSISDITNNELFIGIEPCYADSYGIYAGDQLIVENNITFTSTSGTSTINNGTTNQSGISLDGTVSTQTLTLSALPAITWVSSPDPDLNDGETLSPGNYDRIRAQNNATITLTPGTYNIDEFNLRNDVTVIISPAGQVIINTNEFTAGNTAIINLGGDPANLIVNIYDQHNAEFDLGDDSNFTGIVYSSFASTLIEIDDDNTFTGAIITAGEVELKDNSTINYTAAAQAAASSVLQCTVSAIHHIEFIHDGSALTCNTEQITIIACTDNAVPCTPYTSQVDVTLLPTGWVSGDTKTFTSAAGSAIYNLQHTTAEQVTLSTSSVTPTASNAEVCRNSSSGVAVACTIDFNDSGFLISENVPVATPAIPVQTSCQTSSAITISAVRKSPTTEQCIPFFDGKQVNLRFWAAYFSPATGTKQATLNYGGTDYPLTTTTPGSNVPNVTFNSQGRATFTLNYPDAGELDIQATYTGSLATSDAGLSMSGNQTYITTPAKLYVYSDDANASCASNDGSCSGFKPAGNAADSQFNLKVRAACADNTVTPNFALNGITLSHSNTAPAGVLGSLAVTSFNMAIGDNGEHIISNQAVSEVGAFTFTATSPNYFGITGPTGTSTFIGRFYPHHFDTSVTQACGTFTYSGQDFTVTATAQNNWQPTPTATQNYTDSFAFTTTLSNAGDASNFNGTNTITSFVNGTGSNNNVAYTFPVKETVPATITLRANDADTASATGDFEDVTEIRSGRTRLENSFGSELIDMTVPATVEYYTANGFVVNTADTCSAVTTVLTDLDLTAGTVSLGDGSATGHTCIWDDDAESGTNNCTALAGPIASQFEEQPPINGDFNLNLKAPGATFVGDIGISLTSPTWLQYDWDGDGTHDNDPSSVTSFGLYRGDDRIIYWREVFE